MHFSKKLLLTAVACLAPAISHAAPVTAGTSLSVGGLNFSNFGCTVNMSSPNGTAATPTACDQISVDAITQPGTGISFTSGFTALSTGAAAFSDAVLTYNLSSAMGISSVGLSFNGWFSGLAITSVTESVYDGSQLVGFAKVNCGTIGDCVQSDNITLNGSYNNLFIKKDINVTAANGVAQASYVDQTFTAAPEPGSTALLGSGLLAVAGLLRRRSILSMLKK